MLKINSNILNSIKLNREILYYTVFKYFEFAITGITFFLLAKKVSPVEYGSATNLFLGISYFVIFLPGIFQYFVKHYSNIENVNKKELESVTITTAIVFSFLILFLFPVFIKSELVVFGAFIVFFKYLQDLFINIFRVRNLLKYINFTTTIPAIFLLIFYNYFTTSISDFFKFWFLSSGIGALIGSIIYFKITKVTGFIFNLKMYTAQLGKQIKESYILSILGVFSVLVMAFDRIYTINFSKQSEFILGNMQLADNIASIVSYGFSTIVFAITPVVLSKLHSNSISSVLFLKKGYTFLLGSIGFSFIVGYFISIFLKIYYEEYSYTSWLIYFYIVLKLLVLGLFIPSTLSMINNSEMKISKIFFFSFFVSALLYYCVDYFQIFIFPFYGILILIISYLILLNIYMLYHFKLK